MSKWNSRKPVDIRQNEQHGENIQYPTEQPIFNIQYPALLLAIGLFSMSFVFYCSIGYSPAKRDTAGRDGILDIEYWFQILGC